MADIDKYVDDGYAPVEEFRRICDEMMGVKFILAERKISELLMTIAVSSKLREVVSRSVKDFDFRQTFSEAKIKAGERKTLLLPKVRTKQIALALHLLYAIDVKALPLQEFLEEYFYSPSGLNFSFSLFAHGVIAPLKANVEEELTALVTKTASEQPPAENTPPPVEHTPPPVSDVKLLPGDVVEDILERIADLCVIVHGESTFTQEEKKELYAEATAFREVVKTGVGENIRSSLSDFSDKIANCRLSQKLGEQVEELDETLKHFGA